MEGVPWHPGVPRDGAWPGAGTDDQARQAQVASRLVPHEEQGVWCRVGRQAGPVADDGPGERPTGDPPQVPAHDGDISFRGVRGEHPGGEPS